MWPKVDKEYTTREVLQLIVDAPQPDHCLDKLIGLALGWSVAWKRGDNGVYRAEPPGVKTNSLSHQLPLFTQSVDAAAKLVTGDWFIHNMGEAVKDIHYRGDRHAHLWWHAGIQHRDGGMLTSCRHDVNIAMALCAAALMVKLRSEPRE